MRRDFESPRQRRERRQQRVIGMLLGVVLLLLLVLFCSRAGFASLPPMALTTPAAVPEPKQSLLLFAGLVTIGVLRWRVRE